MEATLDKATPHYVKSLAMAVPAVLIGLQLPAWLGFALSPEWQQRSDFRAYYRAGCILRIGEAHQLYSSYAPADITSNYIHPAYEAVLFWPLSFCSYRTALGLWAVFNLFIIFCVGRYLSQETAHLRELLPWLPFGIIFSFYPVSHNLLQGQDSLLLALFFALALARLRKEDSCGAGALLGVGAFRFQFLAVIVVLFLIWRAWRLVAGLCLSAAAMALLSLLMVGFEGQKHYFNLLRTVANPHEQPVVHMANIRALMVALGTNSTALIATISILGVICIACIGWRASRHSQLLLGICAACLFSYHFFLHDLSLLILPLLVVFDRNLADKNHLNLAILVLVLATPILLAMSGLPLWANSLASMVTLGYVHFTSPDSGRQHLDDGATTASSYSV